MSRWATNVFAVGLIIGAQAAWAAPLPHSLVDALHHGGYVLVMRHASSPANPPDRNTADPENSASERQLDGKGRASAKAMGRAIKAMRISLGKVFSSPTYRARETIRLAGFGQPKVVPALGDQGHSMSRIQGAEPAAWLKAEVTSMPAPGQNNIIVTQMPNIVAAFPDQAIGLQAGETLVFKPDGRGHSKLVAKIPIQNWIDAVP